MNNDFSTLPRLETVTGGRLRKRTLLFLLGAPLCAASVVVLVTTSKSSDRPRQLKSSGSEIPVPGKAEVSSPAPSVVVKAPTLPIDGPSLSPGVTAPVGPKSPDHGVGQGGTLQQHAHELVCSDCGRHGTDGRPLRWDPEPVNTAPDVRVEVTPERPVKGDLVTVRINWSDAEANLVAAQSFCHPVGDDYPGALCGDQLFPPPCPAHGVHELPPPAPGNGVLEFSFTATLGQHRWDHGAMLRSIPVSEGSDCAPSDPYEDHFFVAGVIEVAEYPEEHSRPSGSLFAPAETAMLRGTRP